MKTACFLLVALFASAARAQVISTPLRITQFRPPQLTWTNHIAANLPVYQILRATTVTGAWEHFFFVTNATSTLLTNAASSNAPGLFYKLRWVGDTPMTFTYQFDEGVGLGPCISGQMTVSFAGNGAWNFAEDGFCLDQIHVTGQGTVRPGFFNWLSPQTAQFHLTSPPNTQFLEATLQSTLTNGTLVYTGMVGTVFQNGTVGPSAIGTFKAKRLQ